MLIQESMSTVIFLSFTLIMDTRAETSSLSCFLQAMILESPSTVNARRCSGRKPWIQENFWLVFMTQNFSKH